MLSELRVRQLGVIDDVALFLGPGMTALTGETGAGKTLVVEAIELLLGGRADPMLVRPGAGEASVEGRFTGPAVARGGAGPVGGAGPEDGGAEPGGGAGPEDGGAEPGGDVEDSDDELILSRVVPAQGRSRAYVGGQMASLAVLADAGRNLVDLHGQHSQQSLLSPSAQRAALDTFARVDLGPLAAARQRARTIIEARNALGGDERSRARELDLVRFQLAELDTAGLDDVDEERALQNEEERLGDAEALRQAAQSAHEVLSGDGRVLDQLGTAIAALTGRQALASLHDRLRALEAELSDAATDSRSLAEGFEDDPERLVAVAARRHLLRELRRKYGERLVEVITFRDDARRRVEELESWELRAAVLDREAAAAAADVARAEDELGAVRRAAAPALGAAVEAELRTLALPRARFAVAVGPERAGESVTWMLAANPGEPLLPLAKVASGGELARTMLAVRLVLSEAATGGRSQSAMPLGAVPNRTLIFDEVDAGVGGEAAVAVGRALAALGRDHQVLVVTHLPQVAAFAHQHLAVSKDVVGERTVSRVAALDRDQRVIELSRMLSGQPNSGTARRHAEELLDGAHPERSRAAVESAGNSGRG